MSQSLASFLELVSKPNQRKILIVERNTEESFALHHFISHFLRNQFSICMIGLTQSLNHYSNVANKSSINLKHYATENKFIFNDMMKKFFDQDSVKCTINDELMLKTLYDKIKDDLKMFGNNKKSIIVDDISTMAMLGLSVKDITAFVHYLQLLLLDDDNLCLVFSMHISESDENIKLLFNDFSYSSDLLIITEPLSTGFCKEISGQITIISKTTTVQRNSQKMSAHYRLSDKTASILPKGLSSAVV